ncbi:actin-histidine N-methyltransferase-like [Rhagoletis pomonella]|uniref:actin-histidine N-methyltransferase-like n=1 Tax=Rhagoletis pomonella TaxID=28610 RepID=UPI001780DE08|nr:actin-histidine N-methyltransferase-like [Rhagoletis pomonella]
MGKNNRKKNKSGSSNKNQQPANDAAHAPTQSSSKQVQQQQQTTFKRPTLTLQKRNELSSLISALLEIGFRQPANPKEEWDQYLEIQALLHRAQILEAPLRRPTSNPSVEARVANIENFYRWAAKNGLRYEGVRITQFQGYELGLEATRDIADDELLFSIPRKLILSEENLDLENSPAQFGSMSNLKLSYVLMLEALKPDSFWKPYIDLLPEKYNTVLYFNAKEMEMLRGSNALPAALRQCKAIARQYAFLYNCTVQAPRADKFNPMGQAFKEQFSYELYRWAVSTVMTRENMIPRSRPLNAATANGGDTSQDQPDNIAALIPFWDMANHRQGRVTSFFNVGTQEMESAAQSDFKAGEQIFIHYGDRANADLMIHNGFINPTNPKDYVCIKLGLGNSDPLFEQRAKLLLLMQITKNTDLKVLPPPTYISPELLAFVRVFNMNAQQLEHWITSERAMDLLHIDCALETTLESKTWQYLQTRLMLLLRVFPTTLEADEEQLAAYKKGELYFCYVEAMVLEYRVLEKRILAAALEYARQRVKA